MSETRESELRELIAKATPGPWSRDNNYERAMSRLDAVDAILDRLPGLLAELSALRARVEAAERRLLPEKLSDGQREMLGKALSKWDDVHDWSELEPHHQKGYLTQADAFHAILSRIEKEGE